MSEKLFLATWSNNQLQQEGVLSLESLASPQQFHSMGLEVVELTLSVLALVWVPPVVTDSRL